uniref:Heme chaperone HemW n=1 Tax=Geobacter sp. (strain M21) TaxID=443144 RepID=C6E646_GEOSM
MRAGLYLHFPFCLKKCLYCDFNSTPAGGSDHRGYVELLLKEMELRQAALPEPVIAPTLYLGGGTPSLMAPELVGLIVDAARKSFSLEPDAEVTLEANPGTLTPERLQGYRSAGVNRLSLGIQSFEDRLLKRLGRVHSCAEALSAYQDARRAGFDNISIDLMHSLPGQSLSQWREALELAVSLAPEHVSAYALSIEEGTPFERLHDVGELPLPGEEEAAAMFEATAAVLSKAGYRHYEISNYAKPGRHSRHNSAYWSRLSYLGFGAGAHSFWNPDGLGRRWKNPGEAAAYAAGIRVGIPADEEPEQLTLEDALSECFFLGLRVLDGLDLAPLFERYGESALAPHLKQVAALEKKGALTREGSRIRISPDAVILANGIFSSFV